MYNYFRQYNDNKEIINQKKFYRKFSNEREFGGDFTGKDHLAYSRFFDTFGHLFNSILKSKPKRIIDIGCGNGVNLPLAKIFSEIEYYATDYADKTIRKSFQDYPNIFFQCNDAFNTGYKNKIFDFAIMANVLTLYETKDEQKRLLLEASRILKDDGVLALIVWNESFGVKASVKLSRFFRKLKGLKVPEDFNGWLFTEKNIQEIVHESNLQINQVIHSGKNKGVLESAQWLNSSKFNRKYGTAEKQSITTHSQNILKDFQNQAGKWKKLTSFLYNLSKLCPQWFNMFSIYFISKK